MQIRVLGSGAGGGFPQWNCNCPNCAGYRNQSVSMSARTQSSIAVSENGVDWILINASPDIRHQLASCPEMQPARQLRDTAIKSIILVDAQLDHTAGLLFLREAEHLEVYCTAAVKEDLTNGFPVFPLLNHYCGVTVHLISVANDSHFMVNGAPNLQFTSIPLFGKAPPYSPHRQHPVIGDNIGLLITGTQSNSSVFYAPGIEQMTSELKTLLKTVDCILVDGTFWTENEMIDIGVGTKPAKTMGHLPQTGEQGMLSELKKFNQARRILIHINNTNPLLNSDSDAYQQCRENGIEVAYDGMEIHLP
jgi:pyrroloquinoline quinone biosynthesis protein B